MKEQLKQFISDTLELVKENIKIGKPYAYGRAKGHYEAICELMGRFNIEYPEFPSWSSLQSLKGRFGTAENPKLNFQLLDNTHHQPLEKLAHMNPISQMSHSDNTSEVASDYRSEE